MRLAAFLLLGALTIAAQTLEERVAALAARSAAAKHGFWGALAVDLESGEAVLERDADRLFVPASTVKLFTAAAALSRLGPDHRFRTLVIATGDIGADGTVSGDLCFYGGGDPTLSGRRVPYEKGGARGDPLAPLRELAKQVTARGIRAVTGNIVGDDSAYVHEPYPEGWAQEDLAWEYGAPVSALTLHDNAFRLLVAAGTGPGSPARLVLRPPVDGYHTIENHVKTVESGDSEVHVDWPPGAEAIDVWGRVRRGAARAKLLAIRNPADYAAWVLASELRTQGVRIDGEIRSRHRWMREVEDLRRGEPPQPPAGTVVAERTSPALFEILKAMSKDSQNLHAELVLRELGRARRGVGSRAAGLAETAEFVKEAGVGSEGYLLVDGSGLSIRNLAAPRAIVTLLTHMYLSEAGEGWMDLMAIGGEDGTLGHRFRSDGTRGRVLAKTGTLTGACALSGYADTRSGRKLAFSIMANNYLGPAREARQFIDGIVEALLDQ